MKSLRTTNRPWVFVLASVLLLAPAIVESQTFYQGGVGLTVT